MVKHASAFTQANDLAWNPQTLFRCQCTHEQSIAKQHVDVHTYLGVFFTPLSQMSVASYDSSVSDC